jgi:hypothetical protein
MRKKKEISMFGLTYQMTQMSAVAGFDKITADGSDILSMLETVSIDGVMLNNKTVINEKVKDTVGWIKPRLVLNGLLSQVYDFNFGFLSNRKKVQIPSHLRSGDRPEPLSKQYTEDSPILGMLISEGKATLRELEEYYSLEDAFRLYDIIFFDMLDDAEANYVSMKRR